MNKRLVLSLSFFFLILSCKSGISLQMNKAGELLENYPDSALVVLKTIPPDQLRSPKEKARFALLMSAALDKNYIDVQSDSLINQAVAYYSRKGPKREKMLSLYYNGIILKNAKDYIPSIISFEKSEKEASSLGDNFYLGLIFRNKASIYSLTNNNIAAVDCRIKAISYFEKADATSYKDYAELALVNDYLNNKDNQKADSLLDCLLRRSDEPLIRSQCFIRKASLLVKQNQEPEKAIELYRMGSRNLYGDNSEMNVPSRAFSNVPSVTDSNVPLQMWLL